MNRGQLSLPLIVLLAACGASPEKGEPVQKKQGKSATAAEENSVKTEKKSIEEAANAAAKLVEDEANAEIEALKQDR